LSELRFYVTPNTKKTGHFRAVLTNQSIGLVLKNETNTTKANVQP